MKFLFRPYSIYTRILTTGLIPLALFSTIMCYYIISSHRAELFENLQDTGRIAVHQVAENAAFALYSGDRKSLDSLSYVALEMPSVSGVLFHHYKDDQTITIGDMGLLVEAMPKDLNRGSPLYFDGYWYFYSDIISERTPVMDYDETTQYEPERIGWVLLALTDKILLEKERSFTLTTSTVISLGLLLAFWLSIRLGRTVSGPIQKLTEVVAYMEAGDLDKVAPEEGTVELGNLARGINELATTVRESNIRMQSEIARATSQLRDTLVELEDAMEAKDQFLARMSHELRTPLTAVLGFSNLLSTEDSESKRQEHLRVIQRCSTVLLTMIDDILDFSKADVGGFTLKNTDFDLDKLIDDLITLFSVQAQEKDLQFKVTIEEEVPKKIHGDPVRLAQILANLVNNSIKFTSVGSVDLTISYIGLEEGVITLRFRVVDSGKGIAKDKIPTLFEPFIQEDTSINRRFGGSGLGLSIAKRLVNAMGGDISISSEVDVGSTVTFTCQFYEYGCRDAESPQGLISADLAQSENILSGLSILLAEDNPFNQQLLTGLLEQYGATCLTAKNGLEAIYVVKNSYVDVVLMDLHMPVVDGMVAAETIIQENVDSPPIIGLTADITEKEHQKLIAAGAVSVQLKPIDEIQLINAILAALNDRRKISELSDGGILASVLPAAELKVAICENLDRLQDSFQTNQKANLGEIIHDLMGISGLYGMSELRKLVLDFKACYGSLNAEQNLQKVERIRRHVEESSLFK